MRPKVRLLLPLFIAVFGQLPICSAQDITVLMLDTRSGRPFTNETVSLQFHAVNSSVLQALQATTGADGTARFHVPQPIPPMISVRPMNEAGLYPCSSLLLIDTQQIIAEGLVSRCSKRTQGCRCKFGQQIAQLRNTPGELVLLVRPRTRWERFRSHVWE